MDKAMRIDRDALRRWAAEPTAQRELPLLVAKLVRETGTKVRVAHFPADGGVQTAGFDGVVHADGRTEFVPDGLSVWELSVSGGNGKANEDYEKRTESPGGTPTSDVVYLEVICEPWTDWATWARDRTAEGRWREVRALNVDRLADWLEQAPASTLWLAARLGWPIDNVRDGEGWWTRWCDQTDPPMSADVVLAGRDEAASILREKLQAGDQFIYVGGEISADELRAFVAASLERSTEPPGLARLVFVSSAAALRWLTRQRVGAIACISNRTLLDDIDSPGAAQVITLLPGDKQVSVVVPQPDRPQIDQALQVVGIERNRADDLSRCARSSLLTLRRLLARDPQQLRPSWAGGAVPSVRLRLLLAGKWDETSDGDRAAIEALTERTYRDVDDELTTLANADDDPMVAQLDGVWYVIAPDDALMLVGGRLGRRDLDVVGGVMIDVLAEIDPMTRIDSDARLLASFRGLRRRYSRDLRHGLARTLALLAAGHDERTVVPQGQQWARGVVRELLDRANGDQTLATWESLTDVLSLLAEAAPAEILDAVERLLNETAPVATARSERRGGSGGIPPSVARAVIGALRTVAWSSRHFADAALLLAQLADLDSSDSDRGGEALRALIGMYWLPLPDTAAAPEQRLAVLDRIAQRYPDVAWKVRLAHLPRAGGIHAQPEGPRFRSWKALRTPATSTENSATISTTIDRLIEQMAADPARCEELVRHIDTMTTRHRERLDDQLTSMADAGALRGAHRVATWRALEDLIGRHREFPHAAWSLPAHDLATLQTIADALAPEDLIDRNAWLFDDGWPTLGDPNLRDNYAHHERELARRRAHAVNQVMADEGLDRVVSFARRSSHPRLVGKALAEAASNPSEAQIVAMLGSDDTAEEEFAAGFVRARFRVEGWQWLDAVIASLADPRPRLTARLLEASHDPMQAITRADDLGPAVADAYWLEFSYLGHGRDFNAVDEAVQRLTTVGRPAAALDMLYAYRRDTTPRHAALAADAFEALAALDADFEAVYLSAHEIEELLGIINRHSDAVGLDRVALIELQFAPPYDYEPDNSALHQRLANDPDLFVQLVSICYGADNPEDTPAADQQRQSATRAQQILSSSSWCPGANAAGTIDPGRLEHWVDEARRRLTEAGRADGDRHIGEALAGAAPGTDGVAIPKPIRDLLEELRSREIEDSLTRAICNQRGLSVRGLETGGEPDHARAQTYRSQAKTATEEGSARAARVLEGVADYYEILGRRQDEDTERRRRGM